MILDTESELFAAIGAFDSSVGRAKVPHVDHELGFAFHCAFLAIRSVETAVIAHVAATTLEMANKTKITTPRKSTKAAPFLSAREHLI